MLVAQIKLNVAETIADMPASCILYHLSNPELSELVEW